MNKSNKWTAKQDMFGNEYYQNGRYVLEETESDVYNLYYIVKSDEWKKLGWVNTIPFDMPITDCTVKEIMDSECFLTDIKVIRFYSKRGMQEFYDLVPFDMRLEQNSSETIVVYNDTEKKAERILNKAHIKYSVE